jgi:prophage antirepressor-like protein
LILLVAEFGCFALIFMGALIVDAAERFNGWVAGL